MQHHEVFDLILDLRLWCSGRDKRAKKKMFHLPSLFCLVRLPTIWKFGAGLNNVPEVRKSVRVLSLKLKHKTLDLSTELIRYGHHREIESWRQLSISLRWPIYLISTLLINPNFTF